MSQAPDFTLNLRGASIQVTGHTVGKNQVFRISFPDKRPPLIITKAKGPDKGSFWTSVPEGRHQDAEVIGELIDDHFRNLK